VLRSLLPPSCIFLSPSYACSLRGSCTEARPVKIPLHQQLYTWRGEIVRMHLLPWKKRLATVFLVG